MRDLLPRFFPFLLFASGVAACATTNSSSPSEADEDVQEVQMDGLVVRAEPDPLTGLEDYDAKILFELGAERFRAEAYEQAVRVYEKLLVEFPESPIVPLALYNAGLSYERLVAWSEAVKMFRTIVERYPESDTFRDAHFNLARAYGELEDWAGVTKTFRSARQIEGGLEPLDELEARVGTGVGLFMQEEHSSAEREFLGAVRFYERHERKEYLPAKYFVGQARFYLGEIAARAFEGTELSPSEVSGAEKDWAKAMGRALEEKCKLMLRAQSSFIRAIRVGHQGWATAAGFRIGSLYETLFRELVEVPVPPSLSEKAAEIYRTELRERISVLVKKAIRVYEANREMAERVGEKNEWVQKTSDALERMKELYLASAES